MDRSNILATQTFAPPRYGRADLLIVAGEHSGDQHAARLIRNLFGLRPELRICALGGPEMAASGAQMLYDMSALGVVGAVEVLRHYGEFKTLFSSVTGWIACYRPSVVVFVDYPGFNLRVAERLQRMGVSRKGGGNVALLHYISPQIWAWKAGRRFRMARFLDGVATIFAFETEWYKDTTLETRFVGHPFVAEGYESGLRYDAEGPVLLLPGSRKQAVSRIFPLLLDGYAEYLRHHARRDALVLYPDEAIKSHLERILSGYPQLSGLVRLQPAELSAAGSACLVSSGTMSLVCALASVPGAVCYKAHPITYALGRMLVKIPFLGMANILLPDLKPYPEYLQGAATAAALSAELADILDSPARALACADAARRLREILSVQGAASLESWVLELAGV